MPITLVVFYKRHSDFTPEQFQSYMEDNHVPLLKKAFGPHWPVSYNLRYVTRVKTGAGDRLGATVSSTARASADAPVVLVGSPEDLGWDAIGEMVWRDELHLQQGLAMMDSPDGQRVKEDEEVFTITDELRAVLVGENRLQ
jgi:hypothetical protein